MNAGKPGNRPGAGKPTTNEGRSKKPSTSDTPNINREEGSEVSEAWIPISHLTECFTITNRSHTFTHSRGSEGTRSRGIDLADNTPTAPGHTPT
ncbi:hypothetical protein M513_06433 [Trichuris suis]|uniref:Uncharacterized protein n=1 Tax=Trichuris suis TaxID=68888 RepID=A0A085M5U0_9BILA|nr:hypothetical protein M513_06433 [Trichuris suis]